MKNKRIPLSGLILGLSSLLTSHSALSLEGLPECSSALDFVNGCQVNAVGPNNPSVVTAILKAPTGTSVTTEAEALNAMESLVIAVDGLNPTDSIRSGAQLMADDTGVSILAVDYQYDLSQLGTIEDVSVAFESTLNTINSLRGPSAKDSVVIGFSLGGLISRYALSTMEYNGVDHNVGLYMSYDTPHKGVHIPRSIQNIPTMFQYTNDVLQDVVNTLSSGPIKVSVNILGQEISQAKIDANNELIDELLGVTLNSPVAKQIVIDNVNGSAEYDAFFAQYDALGLPTQTKENIAVTNGNLLGNPQDATQLDAGRYYRFIGRVGPEVTANNQLKFGEYYLQAEFGLYPTRANTSSIFAGFSGVRRDQICVFVCIDNYAGLGATKTFNAPSDIKEYDSVPGGWLDFSPFLKAANDTFTTYSNYVTKRHDPEYKFAFVPTYSALAIDHAYDYSAPVDLDNSPFTQVISMADATADENLDHGQVFLDANLIGIIKKAAVGSLTDEDKVVLWLSDVDTAASCIQCNDDFNFRDAASCEVNSYNGCLDDSGRRGGDATYYGQDLYAHAKDVGYANINSMYDAKYPGEASYTTAELIEGFKARVNQPDLNSYWENFSKADCLAQDTFNKHTSICEKLD